jgi:hypothetical protein
MRRLKVYVTSIIRVLEVFFLCQPPAAARKTPLIKA